MSTYYIHKEALEKFDDDALTFLAAHEIAHDKLGHVAKKWR